MKIFKSRKTVECYRVYKSEPKKNLLYTGVGVGRNRREALADCLGNHMNAGDGQYHVGEGPGERARVADPYAGVPFMVKNGTIIKSRGFIEQIQRFMDALDILAWILRFTELLESLGLFFIGFKGNSSRRNASINGLVPPNVLT